jgi:hypothetical protein
MRYEDIRNADGLRRQYEAVKDEIAALDKTSAVHVRWDRSSMSGFGLAVEGGSAAFSAMRHIVRALLLADMDRLRSQLSALGVVLPEAGA